MKTCKYEVKKSIFVGIFEKVNSVFDVEEMFKQLKKEHKKATHICFAYKIKLNGVELVKFFDDGEPTGTAGRPILSVIEKKGIFNVAVFVCRYFGGVKLGSGGLLRAYSKITSLVLENENN